MIRTTNQLLVLEASPGMVLTNGETYSKQVYLGTADSPDNWREVPEEDVQEDG